MGSAGLALPELAEARPLSLRHKAIRYGRRRPGQLTMLLAALILLCLATCVAGVLDIQQRRADLTGIIDRGGPLTNAAVDIYRSLSDADATAAGAFLLSGLEPQDLRERYQNDIIAAGKALATASAGSSGESAATVTELTAYLPLYTGLVETARAYNRQGLPQGATYLREASYLAQETMLRKADDLYRAETARLALAQSEASGFGVVAFLIGVLALGALVAAQVFLARTTRRVLNAGLLAATLAMLAAVGWFGIASASSAGHVSASRTTGTSAVEAFAQARIEALRARGNEALTLVARGSGQEYEDRFVKNGNELEGLLDRAKRVADADTAAAVDEASATWRKWLSSHVALRGMDNGGDYEGAVRSANETGTLSAGVDANLQTAMARATGRFNDAAASARNALSAADGGMVALAVAAIFGVLLGFAPRLREFR